MPQRKKSRERADRGNGSIYFDETKGFWFGIVSETRNGRRYRRKTDPCKSRSEAKTRLRQLLFDLKEKRTTMQPDTQRVGLYLSAWIDSLTLSQSTILRHSSIFATHVEPSELAGVKMSEVDSQHVFMVILP